jgi:hypothetical protein
MRVSISSAPAARMSRSAVRAVRVRDVPDGRPSAGPGRRGATSRLDDEHAQRRTDGSGRGPCFSRNARIGSNTSPGVGRGDAARCDRTSSGARASDKMVCCRWPRAPGAAPTDRGSGGTGRRTSLRGWRSQERGGSNPPFRTKAFVHRRPHANPTGLPLLFIGCGARWRSFVPAFEPKASSASSASASAIGPTPSRWTSSERPPPGSGRGRCPPRQPDLIRRPCEGLEALLSRPGSAP